MKKEHYGRLHHLKLWLKNLLVVKKLFVFSYLATEIILAVTTIAAYSSFITDLIGCN